MAVLIAGGAALAAGCGGSSSNSSAPPTTAAATTTAATSSGGTLNGNVGPGYVISMDKTSVPAGTYTLNVNDQASIHDFHLTGPGVNVTTDVSGTGKKTFTITLKPGTYTFVCDPHSSSMHGTLTVS